MSIKVDSSYHHSKINDVRKLEEEQSMNKAQKAEETKASDQTPVLQDEYISSKKAGEKPSGLYRLGQDENGNPKVFFDDPKKSVPADGKEQPRVNPEGSEGNKVGVQPEAGQDSLKEDKENLQPEADPDSPEKGKEGGQPKVKGGAQGKTEEICVGSTDQVDREIEKLKEKKKQLEQQIKSASGDEKKVRDLEKKLQQVESELNKKDNEGYRRQHTNFY